MTQIGIEGPHGVGKSTLIARLEKALPGACVAPEIALAPFDVLSGQMGQGIFVLNDIVRSASCDTLARYCLLDRCAVSTFVYQRASLGERASRVHLGLIVELVRVGVLRVPSLVLLLTADVRLLEARLSGAGRRPVTPVMLRRQCEAYGRLARDTRAQEVLGRIVNIEVGPDDPPDVVAETAQSVIERELGDESS